MNIPTYINLRQARELLERMGINFSLRQIKRAAEKNATGQRKLPFFVDPIDKTLKIEKGTLVRIYRELQQEAENNLRE
jgi:hypothetical protein